MLIYKLKELIFHSSIYSFVWFASSAIGILLLPIYTRFLTKVDYGILEILDQTNTIFKIVLLAGFHTALARFFHGAETHEDKKLVVSTSMLFVIFSGILGSAAAFYFSDILSKVLLGSLNYKKYIHINICILFCEMTTLISVTYFVVTKKSKIFALYSFGRLTINILANLYFVIVLKLGAMGILYGNFLALSLQATIIAIHIVRLNGIRLHRSTLLKMLKFGAPLIPASFFAVAMHSADRYLIRYYCSLQDVGIYGLGYKFSFMLNALLLGSFNFIWTGSTMYEIANEPDAGFKYTRITTYFMALFVTSQLALSLFAVPVVKILAAPHFFDANRAIPLVSMGLCFHAFYTFFTVGVFLKKKTWLLNISYLPAGIFNIVCNIIFLPKFGYMAAAWISMLTYLGFAIITYIACRHTITFSFEFKRLAFIFISAIGVYLLSTRITFINLPLEIIKDVCFLSVFFGLIVLSGWLTKGEREFLSGYAKAGLKYVTCYR